VLHNVQDLSDINNLCFQIYYHPNEAYTHKPTRPKKYNTSTAIAINNGYSQTPLRHAIHQKVYINIKSERR